MRKPLFLSLLSLILGVSVRGDLPLGPDIRYALRLSIASNGNQTLYAGWMDSGVGCPSSSRDKAASSMYPTLSSLFNGLPSSWIMEPGSGVSGIPSKSFTIKSASHVNCPAVVSRPNKPCPSDIKFNTFTSMSSFWTLVPVSDKPGYFYIKVPTNGQSRCRNLFLGLPKNCTTSGCAFQLLQGPKNARAHLVWSIEPVTEVSKPLPPFAGLTMNGPYSYLFNQGAESATIRYSKLPEARDFQIILKTPDLNTIWFADKPYRLGGTIPLASFVQGFSQAIGIPNAVITGTSSSNSSDLIKMVVTLSSPLWNATTQTLSFSATRVGSPSSAEQALKNNGAIQMQSVNVFVDNAGLEALTFGAQILNQYVAKGLFWQVASFALVTGLDMISGSSSSSSGATTIQYLQNISAQVQEILSVVQVIDSQVTALVSDVQSLGQDYQSFTANASIANDLFNSGPSSNQGVGTVLSCPNSGSWTNNILFGSSSNAMNLQLALNDLYDSITGTSTQTGVNLIAQLFNQAGGNVCSSSGCDYGAYNTVPYPVSTASPAAQVVEAMNQYVATMINGLSLCNIAANFVSNATALQQSCGYTVTPGEGSILADYCTATTGLNGQNLLTDIYNVVTSSIQTTEVGWQGYLWRNWNFDEPTTSCNVNSFAPDVTDSIMAPAGMLMTSLRFNTLQPSGGSCGSYPYGEGACWISNSYLTLEGNFASVSLSSSSSTGINPGSGYGYDWGSQDWYTNATTASSNAAQNSCSLGFSDPNVFGGVQYISILPVVLPTGSYAVGASLVTWFCSNFDGAAVYSCDDLEEGGKYCGNTQHPWEPQGTFVGNVLGIQLYGASVTFSNTTGEMILGPISAYSNAGDCTSTQWLDQSTDAAPYWSAPSVQSNGAPSSPSFSSYYPPPEPWGQAIKEYANVQLFNQVKGNGNDSDEPYQPGNGLTFEHTGTPPSPSFVAGVSVWLKANRFAIGVFTVPTLINTTA